MLKLLLLFSIASVGLGQKFAETETYNNEVNNDGTYNFQYETSNGIFQQEAGVGSVIASGAAQWYAPDGTGIQFSYTADVNGYKPVGSHLPKDHPLPSYIVRALEYQKKHPWVEPKYY